MSDAGFNLEQRQGPAQRAKAPQRTQERPPPGSVAGILRLQAQAGNRAVAGLLRSAAADVAPPGEEKAVDDHAAEGARGIVARPTGEEPPVPPEDSAEGSPTSVTTRAASPGGSSMWASDGAEGAVAAHDEGASPWAASGGEGIAGPTPVPWESLQSATGEGAEAIPGPSAVPLATIQGADGFNAWRLGWTSFPIGSFKVPQFNFNTSSKVNKAGVTQWYAKPKFTQRAFEGNSVCWYVATGTHPTTHVEGGKPVFWKMPGPMAARDRTAEREHSNDIKRAYKISLKEADTLLKRHIVPRTFGPEASEAAVTTKVLNRIAAKLTHAGLGNDQTKWGTIYDTLYRKTLQRDNKGWHTFALGHRKEAPTKVFYTVQKGTTNVGTVSSAAIVKY
jgi:hypothetical protein